MKLVKNAVNAIFSIVAQIAKLRKFNKLAACSTFSPFPFHFSLLTLRASLFTLCKKGHPE